MAQLITLPAIVADATDAVIESWLVEPGAEVRRGQALADIETEKATVELEAEHAGVVARILIDAGATVEVGTPIAVLAEAGEGDTEIDALLGATSSTDNAPTAISGTDGGSGRVPVAPSSNSKATEDRVDEIRIFASPLARRRARELGVAISAISGSGPGGRILRSDVESAACVATETIEPGSESEVDSGQNGNSVDLPLTGMRRAIARRLTESKTTVPHFYLSDEVCMDALLEFRQELNQTLASKALKATINDLILRGLGCALREVPEANAIWNGSSIRQFEAIDISMAVATDGGLITPVVRDVMGMSLTQLCQVTEDFKSRASDKRIRQHELEGGAFSISNLGMYGTREFAAIINPPQSGILAVGATEQRAVVVNGELSVASMMTVTVSADHRVIDGAVAARLLAAFKWSLENPLALAL
ncbi:dihydrolipoamide acetyltransferase family protein [Brevibacterium casei]|uniref:dihydrolipoamide acetyltransferase family protein n=1 Tax=Brevibacterium casei TaxID=33889 RepID=UPI0036F73498